MRIFLFILISLVTNTWSQSSDMREIEIDFMQMCEDEANNHLEPCNELETKTLPIEIDKDLQKILFQDSPILRKNESCLAIKELAQKNTLPITLFKTDNTGDLWKIKFSFGFTRTDYSKTDMQLKTSAMDIIVRDFEFQERTSSSYYDPANWTEPQDTLRWIDEPTNTFNLSIQKNKNVFYITIFHPKFLKLAGQEKQVTGTLDGAPVNEKLNLDNQLGWNYFGNTYRQLDWQIGYGRSFTLSEKDKKTFTYTPRLNAGISTGRNLSAFRGVEKQAPSQIMGLNASIGQRFEYEYGRYYVYLDDEVTFSNLNHSFMDGTAKYNMLYNHLSLGVGITLYERKRQKSRATRQSSLMDPL